MVFATDAVVLLPLLSTITKESGIPFPIRYSFILSPSKKPSFPSPPLTIIFFMRLSLYSFKPHFIRFSNRSDKVPSVFTVVPKITAISADFPSSLFPSIMV